MKIDFVDVSEVSGDDITREQLARMERRYRWAAQYCAGRDVLELACGTGQGAGLLAKQATSYKACDTSEAMLAIARRHYGVRIDFIHSDAQTLDLPPASIDTAIVCEALYYFADVHALFLSVKRLLRPGGQLLVVTANKDLFDFTPSPHSHQYLGVLELQNQLASLGFECEFFGDTPVAQVSKVQRMLRPIKSLASALGLIPKTMAGKKFLKRLVFGGLVPMPFEILPSHTSIEAVKISNQTSNYDHKVIFCAATLRP